MSSSGLLRLAVREPEREVVGGLLIAKSRRLRGAERDAAARVHELLDAMLEAGLGHVPDAEHVDVVELASIFDPVSVQPGKMEDRLATAGERAEARTVEQVASHRVVLALEIGERRQRGPLLQERDRPQAPVHGGPQQVCADETVRSGDADCPSGHGHPKLTVARLPTASRAVVHSPYWWCRRVECPGVLYYARSGSRGSPLLSFPPFRLDLGDERARRGRPAVGASSSTEVAKPTCRCSKRSGSCAVDRGDRVIATLARQARTWLGQMPGLGARLGNFRNPPPTFLLPPDHARRSVSPSPSRPTSCLPPPAYGP